MDLSGCQLLEQSDGINTLNLTNGPRLILVSRSHTAREVTDYSTQVSLNGFGVTVKSTKI